jgi:DNA primase
VARQKELRRLIEMPLGQYLRTAAIRPAPKSARERPESSEPPGEVARLDRLAAERPNHPAVLYLRERGFDPTFLGRHWAVGYCRESRYQFARERIYIPIVMRGKLRGWQMRHVGDDVCGLSLAALKIPKYWTDPNFPRNDCLYNLDRAAAHPGVVLVEGVTDAWRVGFQAVACFGKTLAFTQARLLVATLRSRHGDDAAAGILLDPDQDAKQRAKGAVHHIERAWSVLESLLPGRVFRVYLPRGVDPGSAERATARRAVLEAAAAAGVPFSFSRPAGA